jgi:hypothetical protein
MESGVLYVVFNKWIRDPETGEIPYKIGITRNSVDERYYGLGLKMPGEFETLFAYRIKDYVKAEQSIHDFYNEYCVNGEWFKLDQKELEHIREKCKRMDGILVTDEIKDEIETETEIKNPYSESLEDLIKTIGMKTFVQYYDKLKNDLPTDIKQHMKLHKKYANNSINTKVSTGKRIFRENMEKQALEIISRSERVEEQIREGALKLLNK